MLMSPVLANETVINILKPYTALCEDSSVMLHHVVDGRWVNEALSDKSSYEIRKLGYSSRHRQQADEPDTSPCTDMLVTELASHVHFVENCYAMKEITAAGASSERSEMCNEYYYDGEIVSVDCRVLSFQPNGTFQSRRWIMSDKPGQDAVLQSSGNCRVLTR